MPHFDLQFGEKPVLHLQYVVLPLVVANKNSLSIYGLGRKLLLWIRCIVEHTGEYPWISGSSACCSTEGRDCQLASLGKGSSSETHGRGEEPCF